MKRLGKTRDGEARADRGSGLWDREEGTKIWTSHRVEAKSVMGCGWTRQESRMSSRFLSWATGCYLKSGTEEKVWWRDRIEEGGRSSFCNESRVDLWGLRDLRSTRPEQCSRCYGRPARAELHRSAPLPFRSLESRGRSSGQTEKDRAGISERKRESS